MSDLLERREVNRKEERKIPLRLFISYAHDDEVYRAQLEKYLIVLKLQGMLEYWDDRKIPPGMEWEEEVLEHLDQAHIIVLLVSIDFLNSGYIRTKEMQRAVERHARQEALVVPVLVRTTPEWTSILGLGRFQALPVKPGVAPDEVLPISKWNDRDDAWENVVIGLRRAITQLWRSLDANNCPDRAAPSPATSITEASAKGLKALSELMASPSVRALVERFRGHFAAASQQIVVLGDLKDLHDALHTLRFQCYSFAVCESHRSEAEMVSWDSLIQAYTTMERLVDVIQQVASRHSLPDIDLAWIGELEAGRQEFSEAIETASLACLKQFVQRIRSVLAFRPLKINIRLSETVRNLSLAELATEMAGLAHQLQISGLSSSQLGRFRNGVKAFEQLSVAVPALGQEHERWQEVDAEMQRIDALLGQDLGDLEFSWSGLKSSLIQLCTVPDERWAGVLRLEIEKLDSALASGVHSRIEQAFRRCYSQAGARFYDVDFKLKDLCDQLRKIGAELEGILKQL